MDDAGLDQQKILPATQDNKSHGTAAIFGLSRYPEIALAGATKMMSIDTIQ